MKTKACANAKLSGMAVGNFVAKTVGVNCKDCVYFSSRNCGANNGSGKAFYEQIF
jgi:hypothetical protein